MNLYDYENNPGIFNIHEEQTRPPILGSYLWKYYYRGNGLEL